MSDDPGWVAYTALGLSVVSTLRPELEAGYYRFFKPPTVCVEQLPQIVLGVNSYGPYLQVSGVMTVSHGSLLMRRMSVSLEREDAPSAFSFRVKCYVGTAYDSATNSADISMPISFSLDEGKPVPFSAVFVSAPDAKEFERTLLVLRDNWATFEADHNAQPAYPGQYAPAQDPWTAFRKDPRYMSCVETLGSRSFWNPGTYRFTLGVETNGKSPPPTSFEFTLAQEDVARILASIPRIPDSTFGYGDPRLAWTSLTLDTKAV